MSRYISEENIPGDSAFVGLAPLGDVGSWQRECKVILIGQSFLPDLKKKIIIQSIELIFILKTHDFHVTFLKYLTACDMLILLKMYMKIICSKKMC